MFAAAKLPRPMKLSAVEGELKSIEENQQYIISTPSHAIVIYKDQNTYFLHDANSAQGWMKLPLVNLFQEIQHSLGADLNTAVFFTKLTSGDPKRINHELFCNVVIALQRNFSSPFSKAEIN